jgi:hypothetical protein
MAKALMIVRAFRAFCFRRFVMCADERAQDRDKRKLAVVKIQALARGILLRAWFKLNRSALLATVSERRPQQLRQQRLEAVQAEQREEQRQLEERNIRRIDEEVMRVIMSLPPSPNRAVLEGSFQRLAAAHTTAPLDRPRGERLKLVPLHESKEGTFVDEAQLLLPGPVATVTGRPSLPRALSSAVARKRAAEDAAAAKVVAQLRRNHGEESATMQYALKRKVDASFSQSKIVHTT